MSIFQKILGNGGRSVAPAGDDAESITRRLFEVPINETAMAVDIAALVSMRQAGVQVFRAVLAESGNRHDSLRREQIVGLLSANTWVDSEDSLTQIALLASFLDDQEGMAGARAVTSLASYGSQVFELLKQASMANNSRTRCYAVQALGSLQDQRVVSLLMDIFGDQDARVRSDVAVALGRQADVRAIPLLLQAMSDTNWQVRDNASIALSRFNDQDIIDQLLPLMHSDDDQLRMLTVRTLSRVGGEKALPLLIAALDDACVDVQGEAADALALYHSAAIVALLQHYHVGDPSLRQRIATACEKIGILRVAAYLADSDAAIRMAVAEMLGKYVSADPVGFSPVDSNQVKREPLVINLLILLTDAWQHEADPDVQMRLVITMGQLADMAAERSPDASIKALIDAAQDSDQAIAYHSKKALEWIHHPLAEQYIQSPLQPSKVAIGCPNCLQTLELTPPLTGKKWQCEHCYLGFTIRPGADGTLLVSPIAAAPVQPVSGSQHWFDVLQLNPDADAMAIKRAFRSLLKQYHPDKVATLGDEFKILAEEKTRLLTWALRTGLEHSAKKHG